MAVGLPLKVTYANGDVYSASDVNDTNGTINAYLAPSLGYAAGKNKIINGDFGVWQRGTSVTVSGSYAYTYTTDRWWIFRTGFATGCSISRQATGDTTNLPNIQYCARYQRTAGNTSTGIMYFGSDFESINSIPYAGKTITFSYYARKGANYSGGTSFSFGISSGTGTDQILLNGYTGQNAVLTSAPALTTTWQRFTATGTVPTNATQLGISSGWTPSGTAGANDYVEITGVQLEAGSVATPFQTATGTIQGELAACQRYYFRHTPGTAYGHHAFGSAISTTNVNCDIWLPVTMRVAPSTLEYGNLAISTGGAETTISSMTIAQSGTNVINLTPIGTGLTQYRPYFLINNNNTAGYLAFSAEL